jgi:cytochrome b561
MWRNTSDSYGLLAIALHWLVALTVVGMFGLGLWMADLNLYHPWYHRAPDIHKSIGLLLFAIMLLRLGWRFANPRPRPAPGVSRLEARTAAIAHALLYLLLFAVMIAGYLISTADGRPVEVFGLFGVPATITGIEDQEDVAGDIHLVLAMILVSLAAVHALAALKHHFIDRDRTLLRMLGRNTPPSSNDDK